MATKISLPNAVCRQALTSGELLVKGLALSFCARAWSSGGLEVGGAVTTGVGGVVMTGVGGVVMTGVGGVVMTGVGGVVMTGVGGVVMTGVDREASLVVLDGASDPQADTIKRRQPAAKAVRSSGIKPSPCLQKVDQQ